MWKESDAYLRLKTIMLSYDIPSGVAARMKIQNAGVFVSGENLFTVAGLDNRDQDKQRYYPVNSCF